MYAVAHAPVATPLDPFACGGNPGVPVIAASAAAKFAEPPAAPGVNLAEPPEDGPRSLAVTFNAIQDELYITQSASVAYATHVPPVFCVTLTVVHTIILLKRILIVLIYKDYG